ncbi:hypothetical protein GCM10010519_29730 [Streptomyces lactacystinicus]
MLGAARGSRFTARGSVPCRVAERVTRRAVSPVCGNRRGVGTTALRAYPSAAGAMAIIEVVKTARRTVGGADRTSPPAPHGRSVGGGSPPVRPLLP